MLSLKDPKFIFVHINKCAGSSVNYSLRRAGHVKTRHDPLRLIQQKHEIDNLDDFFKFSFVRNPWSKMLSFYNYHANKRCWDLGWPWDKTNAPEFKDFITQSINNIQSLYPREIIEETVNIANMCSFTLEDLNYQYPNG